jgi:hypothetical protein
MASVTAFNDMLSQFLVELHKTFPDETGIKKMTTSFELLKTTNPRLIVDGFMKGVTPFADRISAKDEKFILEEIEKIDMLKPRGRQLGNTSKPSTCWVLRSPLSQQRPSVSLKVSPKTVPTRCRRRVVRLTKTHS